jgi:hypothetical protein
MLEGTVVNGGLSLNCKQVTFYRGNHDDRKTYYPNDLSEYRLGMSVYESKDVKESHGSVRYFLRRIYNGQVILYALELRKPARYFLEHEGELKELTPDSYKQIIALALYGSAATSSDIELPRYRSKDIIRAFALDSMGYKGPYPRARMGIRIGLSGDKVSIADDNETLGRRYFPSIGFEFETPFGLQPKWFFATSMNFQPMNFYGSNTYQGHVVTEYDIKATGMHVPMLIKYRGGGHRSQTFVTFGPVTSWYFKNNSDLISDFQFGATLGVGAEHNFENKQQLGIELAYLKGFGADNGRHTISSIQLTLSFDW